MLEAAKADRERYPPEAYTEEIMRKDIKAIEDEEAQEEECAR